MEKLIDLKYAPKHWNKFKGEKKKLLKLCYHVRMGHIELTSDELKKLRERVKEVWG